MVAPRYLLRECTEPARVADGAVCIRYLWGLVVVADGKFQRGESAIECEMEEGLGGECVHAVNCETERAYEGVPSTGVVKTFVSAKGSLSRKCKKGGGLSKLFEMGVLPRDEMFL